MKFRFTTLACASALLGSGIAALAQNLPEVEVMDLRLYNATDTVITVVGSNGRPFDILGLSVGRPGFTLHQIANDASSAFKKDGYTLSFDTGKLRCNGRVISGVSSPYVWRMVATKSTDAIKDQLAVLSASPLFGNETVRIMRQIAYPSAETAPAAPPVVAQLIQKYGPPANRPHRPNEPDHLIWDAQGASLRVNFTYLSDRPGIVRELNFIMTRTEQQRGRREVNYRPQEQQRICAATKPVDEKRIQEMNVDKTNAPRL